MNARQRTVRVGAFVVGGLLLFAVGLFLIGDRRLLFVEHQALETTLTKVTGLQAGTRVRVAGMNAGEVTSIDVPPRPSLPFVVRMRIRSDLAHLVRVDSAAGVQTDGLVGSAFIQIGPGSDDAGAVSPGSRIRGVDPIEFSDVLAETTATLTIVPDVRRRHLRRGLGHARRPDGHRHRGERGHRRGRDQREDRHGVEQPRD